MQSLTFRYYIEPQALEAESGIKRIAIPLQPTVEVVINIPDETKPEQIEQLEAAMRSRGYEPVVVP